MNYIQALQEPRWLSLNHKIGDLYIIDRISNWKIAYYPLTEDNKGTKYYEPRVLVELPIIKDNKQIGIDFREMPLYYLTKQNKRDIILHEEIKID